MAAPQGSPGGASAPECGFVNCFTSPGSAPEVLPLCSICVSLGTGDVYGMLPLFPSSRKSGKMADVFCVVTKK